MGVWTASQSGILEGAQLYRTKQIHLAELALLLPSHRQFPAGYGAAPHGCSMAGFSWSLEYREGWLDEGESDA